MSKDMPAEVKVTRENDHIICTIPENSSKVVRAKFGLVRSLINNMVTGVNAGFTKASRNYRGWLLKAQNQCFQQDSVNIGYSHPVVYEAPAEITLKVDGNKVFVTGIDKEVVGQTASEIRKTASRDTIKTAPVSATWAKTFASRSARSLQLKAIKEGL